MKRQFLLAPLVLALSAIGGTGTGHADEAVGNVDLVEVWAYGTPPESERDSVFRGHGVVVQETLETVRSGFLHVTFVDGTTLALGESTILVLDEFVYDPDSTGDSMVAQLASGLFHLVSGDLDNEGVVLETPALAIGLRGTDIVVRVGEDGTTDLAVRGGAATATPTAGGDTVVVNTGQTATGSPGDTTVILVDGLPNFADRDLPTATKGRRNVGGASGGDRGSGDAANPGSGGDSDSNN